MTQLRRQRSIRYLKTSLRATVFVLVPAVAHSAGTMIVDPVPPSVYPCGEHYDGPSAPYRTVLKQRPCDSDGVRKYQRKHHGIGFEVLDLESQQCFVPDDSYRLLDHIVDQVISRVGPIHKSQDRSEAIEQVLNIGRATSEVLTADNFKLLIGTLTLGDALAPRIEPFGYEWYSFDCDIGALIVLTAASELGVPGYLVEIPIHEKSPSIHDFVRWQVDEQTTVSWDTNARSECVMPDFPMPSYQGQNMTHDMTIAYILRIRAYNWEKDEKFARAVADYRKAINLFPEYPSPYNNGAWLIATREYDGRDVDRDLALQWAQESVKRVNTPNNQDTLACAYALNGKFEKALATELMAAQDSRASAKQRADFEDRAKLFDPNSQRDCTGVAWVGSDRGP